METGIAGVFHERMSRDAIPLYIISAPGKEAVSMLDKLPLNGSKTYDVAGTFRNAARLNRLLDVPSYPLKI